MPGSLSKYFLDLFLFLGLGLLPSAKLSLNEAEKDRQPIKYLIFLEGVFLCITLP